MTLTPAGRKGANRNRLEAKDRGRDGVDQVRAWASLAAQTAAAKGGEDTVVFEVSGVLAITDAFVITSGNNHRLVRAIAEEIEASLKTEAGIAPLRIEGMSGAEWILMDYGDFVVHVFWEETRSYYDLERLWSDAPRWVWEPARSS